MNYSGLFKRSWTITWRYPSMALVVLIGTLLSLLLSFVLSPVLSPLALVASGSAYLLIVIQGAMSLAITAFISGALISMVNSVEEGQMISVGRGIRAGLRRLVPLFFVTLMLQIPLWLVTFFGTGSMLYALTLSTRAGFNNTIALFSSVIFYPFLSFAAALVIGAIDVGAERAIVLEKRSVFAALKTGWNLLRYKLKDFVIVGLIFLLLVILINVISAFMSSTLINATVLSTVAGTQNGFSGQSSTFFSPISAILFIISILFGLFAAVFVSSIWTLAYRQWQSQERSKLPIATE